SVKSTHIIHLPLAFFTITTFANQVGYSISVKKPASFNFLTSSSTTFLLSSPSLCFLCDTGLTFGNKDSLWVMMPSLIPGMS
ncbi:hypothetical protein A2U01_0073949, partial [Trifolium medium]|nr:hypothetical protein [Trifolium medium]